MKQILSDIRAAFKAGIAVWHMKRYQARRRAQIELPF